MEGVSAAMRWQVRVAIAAIIVAIASAMIAVCGCSSVEIAEAAQQRRFTVSEADNDKVFLDTAVITDTETGCQYLYFTRPTGTDGGAGGVVLLVDKYGYPLLAGGYEREYEVSMSNDEGE